MRIGMLSAELLDDSHERVLAQAMAQFLHRGEHGFVVSFDPCGRWKAALSARRAR